MAVAVRPETQLAPGFLGLDPLLLRDPSGGDRTRAGAAAIVVCRKASDWRLAMNKRGLRHSPERRVWIGARTCGDGAIDRLDDVVHARVFELAICAFPAKGQ
jgi:hypothetical protein